MKRRREKERKRKREIEREGEEKKGERAKVEGQEERECSISKLRCYCTVLCSIGKAGSEGSCVCRTRQSLMSLHSDMQ